MARYYVRFLLQNVSDFVWFEVEEDTQEQLHHILSVGGKNRKPFFCFDTKDGLSVAVATAAIQIANFPWDLIPDPEALAKQFWQRVLAEQESYRTDVYVYLAGRSKPLELYSSDRIKLSTVMFELDAMAVKEDNPFLFFQDEDDETMALQANQVMLLVSPAAALASTEEIFGTDRIVQIF